MSMSRFGALACTLVGVFVLTPWSTFNAARANPPATPALTVESPGAPIDLRRAVMATLRANPGLRTFAYSMRAQEARTAQAELQPATGFSVEIENVLGTGEAHGIDAAEATFSLSRVIELGGKRDQRVAVSEFQREAISLEQQAAQLDVLAELTRRFIHLAGDQQLLVLTREANEFASKTVDAVKHRVRAGKSPDVELLRANVELTRAQIELRQADSELLASRRKLAAMWGDPEAAFGPVEADLYQFPVPVQFESLLTRLQENPDFTRFASAARLRDAEIRLAEASRTPDIEVSGGLRHFQDTHDQAFVFGFSMPLFSKRHAAPQIAAARASREQVDAEREAAFVIARAQLFELYQALRQATEESNVLRRDVLPQIQQALRQSEYSYDRGRYSYLELADAQRAYLDVQRALIDAAVNAHTFQTELERLTGEPVSEDNMILKPQ